MISDSDQIYLAVYVLCIVGILCILLHLLYMLNKEKIKIYIFSKSWGKKIFCSEEEKLDENKPFDAFISYSHQMIVCWKFPKIRVLAPGPPRSRCAKKTDSLRHVCLAPAGGPKARDGHHVSA